MTRRGFMQNSLSLAAGTPVLAELRRGRMDEAFEILSSATQRGQVTAATIHVVRERETFTRSFGKAAGPDAMFLLGSISKPVCMTALLTLLDRREFRLDDPLKKFIPQFAGERRDLVTLRHLLTHTSGLPDQLKENSALRSRHSSLKEFVEHAIRTPLEFVPGTKYQYSSMGILLAASVAEHVSGIDIQTLVDRAVFQPLQMRHSAQGLGRFKLQDMVASQTEHAAPEAGGGDPRAIDWDWNSHWWRSLGAPWGGTHASAPDLGKLLADFLKPSGACLKPDTAKLMIRNHNPAGITPRGLGWNVGISAGGNGCSDRTFGHTGSTGTVAWADPATHSVCVVLTSLPARAVLPHPRDLAANAVAASVS